MTDSLWNVIFVNLESRANDDVSVLKFRQVGLLPDEWNNKEATRVAVCRNGDDKNKK